VVKAFAAMAVRREIDEAPDCRTLRQLLDRIGIVNRSPMVRRDGEWERWFILLSEREKPNARFKNRAM
jgi:hypothetical protein